MAASAIPVARLELPRHSPLVRFTHWINAVSFFGLLVSGVAILLAHPRLYWGEVGNLNTPSLLDLPLPFILTGQSGWGRYLHFLSAWFCILNGVIYVASGVVARHFSSDLPYNALQRRTYFTVIFFLFPLMIWTGFAMSPAITSVFPGIVTVFGGTQSARTIHFFAGAALVIFLIGHVTMVSLAGFREQIRAMITGSST
jgi:thiosulfate reductase cytochrome b subunit